MEKRLTIYTSPDGYGDGVTDAEALALATAERAAVLRRWPDAIVRMEQGSGSGPATGDDPGIVEYVERVWNRILSTGGNGGYVPDALAQWAME